jgi:hypothetical protein
MIFTVRDLRRALEHCSDEAELSFAGRLTLLRIKRGGDGRPAFIEFEQIEGYLQPAFIRRNPNVQVVFLKAPPAFEGPVGRQINVSVE